MLHIDDFFSNQQSCASIYAPSDEIQICRSTCPIALADAMPYNAQDCKPGSLRDSVLLRSSNRPFITLSTYIYSVIRIADTVDSIDERDVVLSEGSLKPSRYLASQSERVIDTLASATSQTSFTPLQESLPITFCTTSHECQYFNLTQVWID